VADIWYNILYTVCVAERWQRKCVSTSPKYKCESTSPKYIFVYCVCGGRKIIYLAKSLMIEVCTDN